jgi:DNA-binding SARP family transcriptional activator
MDYPEAAVRITVFGHVRIRQGALELAAGPAQQRAVLALLALAEGRAAGRAGLVEALWPEDPPPSAWNIVQTHVKRLRAVLEPDRPARRASVLLPSFGDGYALRVDPRNVDVARFRALVGRAAEPHHHGDFARSHRLLGEALALWTAPPAADIPQIAGHPSLRALADLRASAVAGYLDAALALGLAQDVVDLAEQAVADDPLDELAQDRLIRVYRAAGRCPGPCDGFR